MDMLTNYIKPELLSVAVVLYFLTNWLNHSQMIKKRLIPLINAGISIIICGIYVAATCYCEDVQGVAAAIFTVITQGVMVAGLSSYIHHKVKRNKEKEQKQKGEQQ